MDCTHKWNTRTILVDSSGSELRNCICEYCDKTKFFTDGNDFQIKKYQEVAENMIERMNIETSLFNEDEFAAIRWLIDEVKHYQRKDSSVTTSSAESNSIKFLELF